METAQEIIKHVGTLSYLGLFGISAAANMLIPIPEEIVLLAVGYVVGTGAFNFWWSFVIIFMGTFLSDMVMFSLSRARNKWIVMIYEKLFAKIVPMRESFVESHIKKIVFISRFLVNLRFIGPFLAGRVRMSYKSFIFWDALALSIYVLFLLWAGHYFAGRIESIFSGVNTFKNIILLGIGLMILWSIGQVIKKAFFNFEKKGEKKLDN